MKAAVMIIAVLICLSAAGCAQSNGCKVRSDSPVYAGPGTTYAVVDQALAGETHATLGEANGWVNLVTPQFVEGYVPASVCR